MPPMLGLLLFLLGGCSGQKSYKVLKLGHGLPTSHPVHQGMVYMQEALEKKSGGKLRMQIYSDGQLGPERVLVELLQIGSLAMTKVSGSVMTGFAPEYGILELPYLFRSDEHRYRALEGEVGKKILTKGEKYWLRGICFYDAGNRSFYTKDKPINTPEDLNGLKIRVQNSKMALNMVNALGASATPISFGELYTALQQGVVDGAENNPPSLYTSRHYEVCKYYTLDQHTAVPDVLIISTKVWDTLTEDEQGWLLEAAEESVPVQKKLWAESVEFCMEEIQKAGVEVIRPDKSLFAEKVAPMLEEFRSKPEIFQLIEEIQQLED